MIPPGITSLADHEAAARQRLDPAVWSYLAGGADDGHTLRANGGDWSALRLLPRLLRDLRLSDPATELFGRRLAHPVLLAPVAYQRLAHADGELASALAASALGAGVVLSTLASTALEDVARVVIGDAGRGPLWFQLYLQPDRGVTRELVQRAEAAGFEALVLTVDAAVRPARFTLPAGVRAVNLRPQDEAVQGEAGRPASAIDDLLAHAPTWRDVEWLRTQTRLPLLLKGVLRADDARQAVALGVSGLVVSNHGGRTLDTAVSTAWALPRIADAMHGSVPLLVDGGIRRGTDVLKAVALGASAVLIGRPQVHGLAVAGAHGVAHVLRLLTDELRMAMAQCGCARLDDVDRDLLA
ncbi:alpha-hydroxy acid oxidase [Aquabacterium sp. J223]|uniref:alpha-hydroxy acid oxidase n=1 Tax=Aquabacterium sp. J223 TaxID=2898431 RepID=UPI0021AE0FB6|nr:alpha-hydroxy acid oxidase [Aquabacterium sp. J223]UUX96058.1 alpha-hydroxy-acid oxidizing protein [Aquabacterium sp. J223]